MCIFIYDKDRESVPVDKTKNYFFCFVYLLLLCVDSEKIPESSKAFLTVRVCCLWTALLWITDPGP